MRDGLDARGLLIGEVRIKLTDLRSLLLSLKTIAEKELTDEEISYDEYRLIASIGDHLEELVTFSADVSGRTESETDDEMAVIADVHTDPNTSQVLEEGVGYPLNLYVIVKIEGRLVVAQGGMFSYFEFLHPMADRLTDEAWQQMLKSESVPELPIWMGSFVEGLTDLHMPDARHSHADLFGLIAVELTVTPRKTIVGKPILIQTTLSMPLDPGTSKLVVTIQQAGGEPSIVPMGPASEVGNIYTGEVNSEGWTPGEVVVEALWQTPYGSSEVRRATTLEPMTDVEEEQASRPTAFRLNQNIPNPFNASTTIRFSVPEAQGSVRLTIYDLLGRKVRTLMDREVAAGTYAVHWDGRDELGRNVSSGVYFYRMTADSGKWTETRKMLLIR